jgi:antitoxin ParD1/3/4
MATMNISLPDEMKAFVEERVESGRYANASDFMRDLVRREMAERDRVFAEIRALADEGVASGPGSRTPEEIREEAKARLKAKARRRAV